MSISYAKFKYFFFLLIDCAVRSSRLLYCQKECKKRVFGVNWPIYMPMLQICLKKIAEKHKVYFHCLFACCCRLFVCFVALRPKSTSMVMAGRSVHLATLFPGQA